MGSVLQTNFNMVPHFINEVNEGTTLGEVRKDCRDPSHAAPPQAPSPGPTLHALSPASHLPLAILAPAALAHNTLSYLCLCSHTPSQIPSIL